MLAIQMYNSLAKVSDCISYHRIQLNLVHHLFLFLLKFSRLIEQNEYGISKIKQNYTQLSWRGFLRMKDDPILDENPDTSSTLS